MTHAELVELARQWLVKKYPVVITDMVSAARETPDAIGFKGCHTVLIECKASRSDFTADKKKWFRRDMTRGMGNKRYFMAPRYVIPHDQLPAGWGLLEVSKGKARKSIDAPRVEKDSQSESRLLISAIRRLGVDAAKGINVKIYTIDSDSRSIIGIMKAIDHINAPNTPPGQGTSPT